MASGDCSQTNGLVMIENAQNSRSRRARMCLLWSAALSLPLWLGALTVAKVVLVPELRAMSSEVLPGGTAADHDPGLYAHLNPRPLLHAGHREIRTLEHDVMRHI